MSALQKYKQEAQDLTKKVTELEKQNYILTVTNAWLTCLLAADPLMFGLISAELEKLEPELVLTADKVAAAKQVLNKHYPNNNVF